MFSMGSHYSVAKVDVYPGHSATTRPEQSLLCPQPMELVFSGAGGVVFIASARSVIVFKSSLAYAAGMQEETRFSVMI